MVKHYIHKCNRDAVSRKFSKWNNANEHMFNTLPVESEFQSDTWHRLQNQFCSQWHNCRSLLISLLLKDYKFSVGFAFSFMEIAFSRSNFLFMVIIIVKKKSYLPTIRKSKCICFFFHLTKYKRQLLIFYFSQNTI